MQSAITGRTYSQQFLLKPYTRQHCCRQQCCLVYDSDFAMLRVASNMLPRLDHCSIPGNMLPGNRQYNSMELPKLHRIHGRYGKQARHHKIFYKFLNNVCLAYISLSKHTVSKLGTMIGQSEGVSCYILNLRS